MRRCSLSCVTDCTSAVYSPTRRRRLIYTDVIAQDTDRLHTFTRRHDSQSLCQTDFLVNKTNKLSSRSAAGLLVPARPRKPRRWRDIAILACPPPSEPVSLDTNLHQSDDVKTVSRFKKATSQTVIANFTVQRRDGHKRHQTFKLFSSLPVACEVSASPYSSW